MKRQVLVSALLAVVLLPMMSGCGGGGGGGSSASSPAGNPQLVQGTVAAPGSSLSANFASHTGGGTIGSETGIAGLTVTVGTISAGGTSTTFTFTPIAGATATTASGGTFSITLPADATLSADMVVVASQGPAPTTLPSPNVLVTPVIAGRLLIDPATTVAAGELWQQFGGDRNKLTKADLTLLKEFLLAVESAASTASGATLSQLEDAIKLMITVDPGVSITLSGIVVAVQNVTSPPPSPNTLTSAGAFTTGTDSNGDSFNGTSAQFTANYVCVAPQPFEGNVLVVGVENSASATGALRRFTISVPIEGNQLTAGTYTGTIYYSEETANGSTSSSSRSSSGGPPPPPPGTSSSASSSGSSSGGPPPPPPIPTSHVGFGPGRGFFNNTSVAVWSAQSVSVTVAPDSSNSSTLDVTAASATYNPVASDSGDGAAAGTFTTSLTGTVGTH